MNNNSQELVKLLQNDANREVIDDIVLSKKIYDISSYSSKTSYKDDIWYLDLYFPMLNMISALRKLNFLLVNEGIRESIKEYLYIKLLNQTSLNALYSMLRILIRFIDCTSLLSTNMLEKHHIESYYNNLINSNIRNQWSPWRIVKFWIESFNQSLSKQMDIYDIKYPQQRNPNDEKYISDYITNQLDRLMKQHVELPLHYRLIYWILRMYPGRGTEVLSYPINCLKFYNGHIYSLCSIVTKTAGSQNGTPKIILIDIKDPIQENLYLLIREQQEVSNVICKENSEIGDFLFWVHRSRYLKQIDRYMYDKKPSLAKLPDFNIFMKLIIKRFNIKDENGSLAYVSSHMFRHNAETDRVETKIFRPIDLRPMSLHVNESMFNNNYHNLSEDKFVKQMRAVEKAKTGKEVLFRGKIVRSNNDAAYDYFLNNPFAYKISDMGICSDMKSCSKDKLQCLNCDYFVPNAEDLQYFIEQLEEWSAKLKIAQKLNNKKLCGNIEYNILLFKNTIIRIKNAVDKENNE